MKTLYKTLMLTGAAMCLTTAAVAETASQSNSAASANVSTGANSSGSLSTNETVRSSIGNRNLNDDVRGSIGNRTTMDTDSTSQTNIDSTTELDSGTSLNADAGVYSSSSLSQNQVMDVQDALRDRGYSLSSDGVWGTQTTNSLRRFQRENDLDDTGMLDTDTLGALELQFDTRMNNDARASDARASINSRSRTSINNR